MSTLALAVAISLISVTHGTEAAPGEASTPSTVTYQPAVPQYTVASSSTSASPPASQPLYQPAALPQPKPYTIVELIEDVNITFYDCANQGFCDAMYNGEQVYEGAAACSWNLDIGTTFVILDDPTERVYICEDRGLLADTWVDIFWYYPEDGWDWQANVGRYGTVAIVEMN